jgi:hypothetical protein
LCRVDNVHSYIDPNGGGKSQFGLFSTVRKPDGTTVLVGGAAASNMRVDELKILMQQYWVNMKRHPLLGRVAHVAMIEQNYVKYTLLSSTCYPSPTNILLLTVFAMLLTVGGTLNGDIIHRMARQSLPQLKLYFSKPNTPTVMKTHENTATAVVSMSVDLIENKVSLIKNFVTNCSDPKKMKEKEKQTLDQWKEQAQALYKDEKTRKFTAKCAATHWADDLLVCCFMSMYYAYMITGMALVKQYMSKGSSEVGPGSELAVAINKTNKYLTSGDTDRWVRDDKFGSAQELFAGM